LAGQQENNIARHQSKDRVNVARLGRRHPGRDQLAYLLFVAFHACSLMRKLLEPYLKNQEQELAADKRRLTPMLRV
jgi:hypothetical protein